MENSRLAGAGNTPVPTVSVWVSQVAILTLLTLPVALPATGFAESIDSRIQDGISKYHEGQFKEASENFSFAHTDRPEDARIAYNLGNAHYKEGKFEDALKAYSSLDEKNPDIRKNSLYNIGNTLVKLGKLKEAESAYKKVLTLDSSDMDAKFNLEVVRQLLKEKEKQKSESGEDQQKNSDKNEDKNPSQEKGEKKDDPQAENQPENQENNNTNDSEASEQSGEPDPQTQGELSEKEATRMLDRLTEDLKSISRMQAGKTKSAYQGNDW